jgi:myo-inositol-1(or 4)-monophosphatase
MKRFAEELKDIAREVGVLLLKKQGKVRRVEYKGWANIVTEADKQAEAIIVRRWSRLFPDHSVLCEERGAVRGTSPFRLIVDPLDGTTNFSHGFPFFCVSLGLEKDGVPVAAAVHAPYFREMFTAEKGKGAFLNGQRIRVSRRSRLHQCLLATGFSYQLWEREDNNMDHFVHFLRKAQAVRRPGAAALDLCYVACGRLDGFWEIGLKPWDVAAGRLIVAEAGGRVTNMEGKPYVLGDPDFMATNGSVHRSMIRVFRDRKEKLAVIRKAYPRSF